MKPIYLNTFILSYSSDELRSNIRDEIEQSKKSLETATRLAADALKRANDVYDEALTLFANVSALTAPEINLDKLKQDSARAIEEVLKKIIPDQNC